MYSQEGENSAKRTKNDLASGYDDLDDSTPMMISGAILPGSPSDVTHGLNQMNLEDDMTRWEVRSNEMKFEGKLGSGSYGVVFKGKLRGKPVAVKKLFETSLDAGMMESFKKEVAIMSKLRHPNVLLFMGACTEPGNLLIVTELMPKGSVYDLLHDPNVTLSFQTKMKIAKDAAMGMNWLHLSKPVFIHRDLKTGNLLVDENWNVKVADFGLSHMKKNPEKWKGSYGAIGTPLWMAPEVLMNKAYNESSDVYSFGIVLWELLTQEEPFPEIESFDVMLQQVCVAGERPPIPDDTPPTLKTMIQQCWHPIPEQRASFDAMIPLFDKIVIEKIIRDPQGQKLWESEFLGEESISWIRFAKGYSRFSKIPWDDKDVLWVCLKTVLDPNGTGNVTMDMFAKQLEWFGPMSTGVDFLKRIEALLKEPYFHGDLDSNQAEKLLLNKEPRTFLVRFSGRDPGCYAISTVGDNTKVKHFRVLHRSGTKFRIGNQDVEAVQDCFTKYGKELGLERACPGSPYTKLFSKDPLKLSEGYQMPEFD